MIIYGNTLFWVALLAINIVVLVLGAAKTELEIGSVAISTIVCALCSWKVSSWIQRGIEDFKENNP